MQEEIKAEPIEECSNDQCQAPIYEGQKTTKAAEDIYCSVSCAMHDIQKTKPIFFII